MKIFQTLINYPKIKFSDHKAAAGAVRRRRKRQVAAGCKPASAWSAVFSKGVQSRKKTSIIYTKNHHFDNTFNPIENIYSFCIRSKNITRVSKNHARQPQNPIQTAHKTPLQHLKITSFTIKTHSYHISNTAYVFLKIQVKNSQIRSTASPQNRITKQPGS